MRAKIPVAVLGATGMVGQKFVELLADHPWFEIVALAASARSQNKSYGEAVAWKMASQLPPRLAELPMQPCKAGLPGRLVFSGLDASVAGDLETQFATAGATVVSNARNHRLDPTVPLLIPEVNADHLSLLQQQSFRGGGQIVTNPNCSVSGLALALKPLDLLWGVEKVHVVTMQALSGAGYPGIASFDMIDNVIPYIKGEEEKIEKETLKILGQLHTGAVIPHTMQLSAHCNRVAVLDGHMACVSVQLRGQPTASAIIEAWQSFTAVPQQLQLPTAPATPLIYLIGEDQPQPRHHRQLERGMAVVMGRLRPCPLLGWKFVLLSHNTVRGAAGSALLNAELLVSRGYCS